MVALTGLTQTHQPPHLHEAGQCRHRPLQGAHQLLLLRDARIDSPPHQPHQGLHGSRLSERILELGDRGEVMHGEGREQQHQGRAAD